MNLEIKLLDRITLLLFVFLSGCSGRGDTPLAGTVLPVPNETIHLIEELRFGHDESSDEALFQFIGRTDVDSDGRMYVIDMVACSVSVVDSTGHSLATLGGCGEAPGEFQGSPGTSFVDGDSITVFAYGGMTVFNQKDYQFRALYRFPKTAAQIHKVFTWNGDTYTAQTLTLSSSIVQFQMDNEHIDVRYRLPPIEALTAPDGFIEYVPYLPHPRCAATSTRIYCGSTRALIFSVLTLEGDSVGTVSVPYEAFKFTRADQLEFTKKYSNTRYSGSLAFPEYWPVFDRDLVGDDEGRLWVTLFSRDNQETTLWVLDVERNLVKEARVPGDFWASSVRGNKLYGRHTAEDGTQSVVRYRLME